MYKYVFSKMLFPNENLCFFFQKFPSNENICTNVYFFKMILKICSKIFGMEKNVYKDVFFFFQNAFFFLNEGDCKFEASVVNTQFRPGK